MSTGIEHLLKVMAQLRDPKTGCAWDLQQDFKTIAPYTLEETYEVVDAIERNDMKAIKEELGDLLFQVVFHAQVGADAKMFTFDEIAQDVADKMIERHPHVFGDRDANTAATVEANWEADKAKKRAAQAAAENRPVSVLDGVTAALPAMTLSVKLQGRAARVGFDWPHAKDVLVKIREEIEELHAEIESGSEDSREDELGDVLFAVTNLARKLKIDPETALRRTNRKFDQRFRYIENQLRASGRDISTASLDEMENLWNEAKAVKLA